MKWLVPFLFVSTSAFACVDLTGVYKTCERIRGGSSELPSIGFTFYKDVADSNIFLINGREIVANDLARTETPEQTGNDNDLQMTYSCDETSFTSILRDSDVEIRQVFTKRNNSLLVDIKGSAPYDHINDLFICD